MSINLEQHQPSINSVSEATESKGLSYWLNKDIQLFGAALSLKKKEAFYSEMEVLLKAGLDLRTALELVEDGQKSDKDKVLFASIREAVIRGHNLSKAMDESGKFSAYEVNSLQIAEESGRLVPILSELSQYFAKSLQYRRLLMSALSYPIVVVSVALLAVAFLLNFLVPLFGDIYARLDQELPALTLMIVRLSEIVNEYMGSFSIGILVVSIGLFTQRKKDWLRKITAFLIIRIPIFGGLIRQVYLARFCQAMAFLLSAHVPALRAIELTKKMIGFYTIEQSLDIIAKDITRGAALFESLRQFSIYPHRMIALIKVGEEANQLEAMFSKLAEQYNNEVEQQTKMLGSLIEPVIIVFLALVVGLVLVAMYLPIFKLVSNFGV